MTEEVLAVKPAVDVHQCTLLLFVVQATPEGKITLHGRLDYNVYEGGKQVNMDAVNLYELIVELVEKHIEGGKFVHLQDETTFESVFKEE